jgi:hypothetical protein
MRTVLVGASNNLVSAGGPLVDRGTVHIPDALGRDVVHLSPVQSVCDSAASKPCQTAL